MRTIIAILSGVTVLMGAAVAHRQPEMVTTVEYVTEDDGRFVTQVIHRVHAHDAMKMLSQSEGVSAPNLEDPDLLKLLASKILSASTFSVEGIPLGTELDGNYLFVYEEIEGKATLLEAHGLRKLSDDWTHRVDVLDDQKPVLSHTFSEHRGTQPSPKTASPTH